jgi:hypothetical protein
MSKKLEQHIQQMAEKFDKKDEAVDTIESPSEFVIRIYKEGIKDADAVGFANWTDENYHKDNNTLWFNRYDNEPKGFSTEELYLTYLKTK